MNVNYIDLINAIKGTFILKPISELYQDTQQESLLISTSIMK
jgi:hypothetical protein